jgi:transposase
MWVPPEIRDPIVMHAPTRKSVACFGAVNLSTGRFVTQFNPVFNGETFEAFLRHLLRHRRRGRRMVVVLDNAAYHHSKSLKPLLCKYRRLLLLLFLPPYSPQLSPIERVWKLARRLATHNRYFATLPAVLKTVTDCFRRWEKANEVLRRLCCII